jgi:hypothetical protein
MLAGWWSRYVIAPLLEKSSGEYPAQTCRSYAARLRPRAARGPAGGRTPRASACGCIEHSAARRRRRRLEQVEKV